jgi:hypothetical protein
MTRLTVLAGVIAAGVLLSAPTARGSEVQAWKTQDLHMHQAVDLPELSTLSAPRDVTVNVLLHNNPTSHHVNFVRWSDGSNVKQSVSVNWTGNATPEQAFTVTLHLDPAKFDHDGWREVRITTNKDKPDREFTTTRIPVYVTGSGKSVENYAWSGSNAGRCGGGSWYPDLSSNYRIAFVDCRDIQTTQTRPLVAGDTIRVKAQDGGLFANLDPHFHAGDPGQPMVVNGAANTWKTVTIPAGLAPGVHKLHIRSQTGVEAGAFVLSFTVA